MQHISRTIEMPERRTQENPASTELNGFDHGFETLGEASLEAMLDAAKQLCGEIDSEAAGARQRWLSLLGPSGCGKTHLARAVHAFATKRRSYSGINGTTQYRDCLFRDCHTLAKKAREGDWSEIDFVSNAWFLVLDDIGAARDPSGFLGDTYLRILNRRLGRWTVITSNLYAEDIADQIDSRIASRLFRGGSRVIESTSSDWCMRA